MSGILEGLRVVDCSWGTAGPQATRLLADYGADVVWVEPPGGDPLRRHAPAAASVFNRGKRSIVLDLKDATQREHAVALARRADVFVESWRPGVAERLGLDFDTLHEVNPGLVYCSISGFGSDGPSRDVPGYESFVHAVVGTMAQQAGHREGPIFQGLPFASNGAAQLALVGTLAALYRRLDDGVGRHVETSLVDGALAFLSMLWGESDAGLASLASTDLSMKRGSGMRLITRSFVCSDGEYIGIHTGAVGAFGRLMQVLGLDDRIPPSETGIDMGVPLTPEQAALLERELHPLFAAQSRAYWVERLMAADVCAVEHLHPTEVFDEPQPRHNQMVIELDDPVLGRIEQVAPPIRFDGARPDVARPAPTVGQHTHEVLAELASADAAPAHLAASVRQPDERPLLHDVKIVDIGAFYAGPYSSRLLADLGADVIKVEPVLGDPLRGIERPFFSAQAGKRSLAVNLKDPGLRPAVDRLLDWADVVHHNMRPGAAERLGLGAEQIRAAHPDVVYLYAPGWGSSGPHMMRQSFAPMLSGYVGASYEVAGQFNEPMPSTGNEDPGNGLLGAIAVLIALIHRRTTGDVLSCENPQVNAAMSMMAHVVRTVAPREAVGAGLIDPLQFGTSALERLYQTTDGWLVLVALEDADVGALGSVVGIDLLADPRFATVDDRKRHDDALSDLLRASFATRSTKVWLDDLTGLANVAAIEPSPSNMHAFMNDLENRRTGRVGEVADSERGNVRELAVLVRVSDADVPPHRLAPALGEHSDEILTWLGYKPDEIAELRERGAVR
jgi:crotonobetainyl-CoA:carnitine CoA-transferase CaiB-like acyl-CoA transferase